MNTQTLNTSPENAPLSAAPDLAQRAPRSPRCRLGGFALLPRLLDKCRARLAGSLGDYHFNCPLDQQFLSFVGISADALEAQVAAGKSDGEVLQWIQANASHARSEWEIEQWSAYQERRAPAPNTDPHAYFAQTLATVAPARSDIRSWADLLDLDDYCSFGGAA